jgi:hypothetical protein
VKPPEPVDDCNPEHGVHVVRPAVHVDEATGFNCGWRKTADHEASGCGGLPMVRVEPRPRCEVVLVAGADP